MDRKRADKAFQTLWQQWHAAHTKFCRAAADVENCLGSLHRASETPSTNSGEGRDDPSLLFEEAVDALHVAAQQSAVVLQQMYETRAALTAGSPSDGADYAAAAGALYSFVSAQLSMAEQEMQLQDYTALALASPEVDIGKVQTLLTTLNTRRVGVWLFCVCMCAYVCVLHRLKKPSTKRSGHKWNRLLCRCQALPRPRAAQRNANDGEQAVTRKRRRRRVRVMHCNI
jgi:hypothetical protein